MKRKWEVFTGGAGGLLSMLFIGGLSVTLNNMSLQEFSQSYQRLGIETSYSVESIFESLKDVTGLFTVSLFISLIFLLVAVFLSLKEKFLGAAATLYFIAGVILLLGTQFIAFPFAFFYFAAGILSIYRKRKDNNEYALN